jgi:hypothetical protein
MTMSVEELPVVVTILSASRLRDDMVNFELVLCLEV